MSQASVSGTTLHYQEQGTGRPLVLLHGFPLDSRIWREQIAALSDRFRVIAPDLRGFGQSKSADMFTIESLADDVHALLAHIGALPAVVGGLSMGGYVALAYSKKYPTDLLGLVLIDTKAEGDSPQGKQGREKLIELARSQGAKAVAEQMMPKMLSPGADQSRPQVKRELDQIMNDQPPLTIEHALAGMRDRPDLVAHLPSIATPTLVIVGEHDALTPPVGAEKMSQAIPNSTYVLIHGAGHMSPMEQPQQVTDALRKFASNLR
ncbi:MAG TPA: alpha/beta fold hydrolase [Tepidisphaeraceae bacterium]|nr:alpha/beta fold hydrolase [Tepidisphaeraceae bacterium]